MSTFLSAYSVVDRIHITKILIFYCDGFKSNRSRARACLGFFPLRGMVGCGATVWDPLPGVCLPSTITEHGAPDPTYLLLQNYWTYISYSAYMVAAEPKYVQLQPQVRFKKKWRSLPAG
jgi:hypothetical protein